MFVLNLVTPEKKLVTDLEVEEVLVPGHKGQLDILPGHAPLMTTLGSGVVKYRAKNESKYVTVAVSWGYAEVHPEGVIVLAEVAEAADEIDRARAEAGLKNAEQKLLDPFLEADQVEVWRRKIAEEQSRLDALSHGETTH